MKVKLMSECDERDIDRAFSWRKQAEGAYPNGTKVQKCNSTTGDHHHDGAQATVLGSIGPRTVDGFTGYAYCLEYDDYPGVPMWIRSDRVELVPDGPSASK